MEPYRVSCEIGGKPLFIETGKLAKQADGSVLVGYGDTRVLVTACSAKEPKEGASFFPLMVEFSERFYSAGKIPGGFFKREGRPSSEATLTARMIDRPIRPLFPKGYLNDTQIVATVLSLDNEANVQVAASIGASAALHVSDIPFNGPTAACHLGRIDGEYVINSVLNGRSPEESDFDVFVAGTQNGITMVEGDAHEVPESEILEAILRGHEEIQKVTDVIDQLREKAGKPKRSFEPREVDPSLDEEVAKIAKDKLNEALRIQEKHTRYDRIDEVCKETLETLVPESLYEQDEKQAQQKEKDVQECLDTLKYNLMRSMVLDEGLRIDGRDTETIRPISVEAGLLPRAHGSSLFTRGETQILATVTLGTKEDEQMIDSPEGFSMRGFLLHYNFPPYSVGETGRVGGQSRREIGHGMLAERSVHPLIPNKENFPYTIRVVCETLESNGSSSMGSVCSASMALMDAGVPVQKPVGGIAMGLVKEGDKTAVLSDILGDEDHLGDMDFKVAGTREGVTGIQMDIKIEGVDRDILQKALNQARDGRLHILDKMSEAIEETRSDLSAYAPRITSIQIPQDKIRDVIGKGGETIRDIIAQTGAKVNVEDEGKVSIASNDKQSLDSAVDMIRKMTAEVEKDEVYTGVVKRIVDFGAFVEVLPNKDGLLHVSEIAHEHVNDVRDYLQEGDEVQVKVLDIEAGGRFKLSRKALMDPPEGHEAPSSSGPVGGPSRSNKGGRDGGPGKGPRGKKPGGGGGRR